MTFDRQMMRNLTLVALLGGSVSAMSPVGAAAQNKTTIPAGAQIYLDRLEAGFETDLRAELQRQKVPLQIVSSEDQAHFVMGNSEAKDLKLSTVEQGLSLRVRRTGTLTVREKSSNTVVWSEDWQVNSFNPKDERKAASQLVEKLKKIVRRVR
jgi:hypothetical protein